MSFSKQFVPVNSQKPSMCCSLLVLPGATQRWSQEGESIILIHKYSKTVQLSDLTKWSSYKLMKLTQITPFFVTASAVTVHGPLFHFLECSRQYTRLSLELTGCRLNWVFLAFSGNVFSLEIFLKTISWVPHPSLLSPIIILEFSSAFFAFYTRTRFNTHTHPHTYPHTHIGK